MAFYIYLCFNFTFCALSHGILQNSFQLSISIARHNTRVRALANSHLSHLSHPPVATSSRRDVISLLVRHIARARHATLSNNDRSAASKQSEYSVSSGGSSKLSESTVAEVGAFIDDGAPFRSETPPSLMRPRGLRALAASPVRLSWSCTLSRRSPRCHAWEPHSWICSQATRHTQTLTFCCATCLACHCSGTRRSSTEAWKRVRARGHVDLGPPRDQFICAQHGA